VRISLFVPSLNPVATPAFLDALARGADRHGIHALWAPEHVVLFDDYASSYPYSPDGRIPAGGETGMLDPFPTLTFLAARSERVRLGTGICLLPQRNPVYAAKEVATLDWLSGGRIDFGIGVGWLAEEFQALGVPFERRGARCREYVEVMKRLWCDPVSEHKGEFYDLPACRQYPKPVQSPHPPLYFGGESEAALRRVADLGAGWYGFAPEKAPACVRRLEELLRERGRRPEDVEIVVGATRPPSLDLVKQYRDAGAGQAVLMVPSGSAEDLPDWLARIADEIVGPAGDL